MAAIDEPDADFDGFNQSEIDETAAHNSRRVVVDPEDVSSDIEISDLSSSEGEEDFEEDTDIVGPLLEYGGTFTKTLVHAVKFAFTGPTPGPTILLEESANELNFFHLFFTLGLIDLLVKETNRYAEQKQGQNGPDRRWREVHIYYHNSLLKS